MNIPVLFFQLYMKININTNNFARKNVACYVPQILILLNRFENGAKTAEICNDQVVWIAYWVFQLLPGQLIQMHTLVLLHVESAGQGGGCAQKLIKLKHSKGGLVNDAVRLPVLLLYTLNPVR